MLLYLMDWFFTFLTTIFWHVRSAIITSEPLITILFVFLDAISYFSIISDGKYS